MVILQMASVKNSVPRSYFHFFSRIFYIKNKRLIKCSQSAELVKEIELTLSLIFRYKH